MVIDEFNRSDELLDAVDAVLAVLIVDGIMKDSAIGQHNLKWILDDIGAVFVSGASERYIGAHKRIVFWANNWSMNNDVTTARTPIGQ
jgi:hypothetical protein